MHLASRDAGSSLEDTFQQSARREILADPSLSPDRKAEAVAATFPAESGLKERQEIIQSDAGFSPGAEDRPGRGARSGRAQAQRKLVQGVRMTIGEHGMIRVDRVRSDVTRVVLS